MIHGMQLWQTILICNIKTESKSCLGLQKTGNNEISVKVDSTNIPHPKDKAKLAAGSKAEGGVPQYCGSAKRISTQIMD